MRSVAVLFFIFLCSCTFAKRTKPGHYSASTYLNSFQDQLVGENCSNSMEPGEKYMHSDKSWATIVEATTVKLSVWRGNNDELKNGTAYIPGETLIAKIKPKIKMYVLDIETALFSGKKTDCGGKRQRNWRSSHFSEPFTVPTDATKPVILNGVAANGYGRIVKMPTIVLNPPEHLDGADTSSEEPEL